MEELFREISPAEITGNVFERIGKQWMLITAGREESFNTMTASWGSMGILWGKNVAFVFVRDHRHTFKFMEENEFYTLSFYGEEYREALQICGTLSGRDVNKPEKAGLTPAYDEKTTWFNEAEMVITCRKLYRHKIDPNELVDSSITGIYPQNDYHYMYVGEIERVKVKK